MGIYSSVDCQEVKDTASEDWNQGGIQASVVLAVSGANKDALCADILSNQRVWPAMSSFATPPRAFQCLPVPFYSVSNVSGQMYVWDEYRVTVKYTTNPERTLFNERIEPAAEFQKLDHRYFRWTSGAPLTEGEAPGLLMRSLNLVRNYVNALSVPPEVITGIGKVHNADYTSTYLGLTFPAETLLFLPNPIDQSVTTLGSQGYNYTVKFAYKPNGWNKFYRPSTNSWENIYDLAGSIIKPYPPANLAALLS